MPKKLQTNQKAVEARERKAAVKKAKSEAAEQAYQNELWKDEGSTASERRQREKAQKSAEEARKRAEKKALQAKEEQEMNSVKLAKSAKITQFQLRQKNEQREKEDEKEKIEQQMKQQKLLSQTELVPNVNIAFSEQIQEDEAKFGRENVVSAQSIDEALEKLTINSGVQFIDKHPERRMKAAYRAYESEQMPILKEQFPTLKYSQLKERLWQNWLKAPENPIVQAKKAQMEVAAQH